MTPPGRCKTPSTRTIRKASEVKRPAALGQGLQGLHLTADLRGCACDTRFLKEPAVLTELCRQAVVSSGLQPVAELFHPFQPAGSGVTGVILLAESHLAVHTWPELSAVTLDAYVCNFGGDNSAKAQGLMALLIASFAPSQVVRHQLTRGNLAPKD
jgi:S-adenosylmethionine decarboxylase